MRILMVASEAHPFAKTGGLADVVSALPRALTRLGHQVDVLIPRYRGISGEDWLGQVRVDLGTQAIDAPVSAITREGVRTIFVEHNRYFGRDALYGTADGDYPDNAERFAFLAHAALEWAARGDVRYDIVHAHDWQAGLVPVLLSGAFANRPALARTRTIFTIHDLAYQGLFDANWIPQLGLSPEVLRVDALEYWGRISFLKGGIVFSRTITTVSPRYSEEIQTPEYGFGFDGILRARRADLVGILNGIDYDQWNPERDPYLPEPFCASRMDGKRAAKRAVLERYAIPVSDASLDRPIVGMISRLVDQKGFDLVAALAEELPRSNASYVLLGTGERRYEELWRDLAARYPDRIAALIGFDEGLAHLVEGGADLFLMPSRFEPCGLNQLYSLRYGTVPVVRATGGLFDTVRDYDPKTGEGTGFTFDEYSPEALGGTLLRALDIYEDKPLWRRIQLTGMEQDFSWDASARQYATVYERAIAGT